MPIPLLPEALTTILQLDRAAALAAAFVIGTHHADVLQWVARTIGSDAAELQPQAKPKANGAVRRGRRGNARNNGDDPYLGRRLAKREIDDQALIAAMRRNTEATIGELATAVGKSRTSIVSALQRLRAAGLAQSVEGKWRLTEPPAPREPAVKWVAPVSATRAHAHA